MVDLCQDVVMDLKDEDDGAVPGAIADVSGYHSSMYLNMNRVPLDDDNPMSNTLARRPDDSGFWSNGVMYTTSSAMNMLQLVLLQIEAERFKSVSLSLRLNGFIY